MCSPQSRRVAALRPRFAGLTALPAAPRTLVQTGLVRRRNTHDPLHVVVDDLFGMARFSPLVDMLTDLAGFLCLVPACRQLLKRYLHQRFEGTMRRGGAGVRGAFVSAGEPSRRSRMKNVTPRRPTDPGR